MYISNQKISNQEKVFSGEELAELTERNVRAMGYLRRKHDAKIYKYHEAVLFILMGLLLASFLVLAYTVVRFM